MDIIGPFPQVPDQLKFLIVGEDYFTKWIEAKVVAKITIERVRQWYGNWLLMRFRSANKVRIFCITTSQWASRISKQSNYEQTQEKAWRCQRLMGRTSPWNIMVISHHLSLYYQGNSLLHGIWSKGHATYRAWHALMGTLPI